MAFTDSLLTKALFALAVGALVGLERERFKKMAGLRTFMLTSLFGMLSAHLARTYPGLMLVAGGVAGAIMFVAYWVRARRSGQTGLTTVLALGVSFLLGVLAESGEFFVVASISVIITLALAGKKHMQRFARRLTQQELLDALKFLIATVVILPILPNTAIDPWGVFNPFEMWLLAVLVLSVSFVGYVAMKILGPAKGTASLGLLGGMASSTAVTSAMAARVKATPKLLHAGTFAVVLASSTMFARSLIVLGALNEELAGSLLWPFVGMSLFGWLVCAVLWLKLSEKHTSVKLGSSFAIMPALKFAALYTLISFVSFFAQRMLGDAGVITTAILAGLVDVDVVTTSMATLLSHGDVSLSTASYAVFLGALSNTAVKWFMTYSLGTKRMARTVGVIFLLMVLFGAGVFLFF